MKKLKDFIYDYNDVVVAVIIVIVAGLIIFWRIDAALDYPKYLEAQGGVTQIDIDFSNIDLNPEQVDVGKDVVDETKTEDPTPATCEHVYEGGVCTKCGEPDPTYVAPVEDPTPQVKTYTLEVSKKAGTTNWTSCGKLLEQNGIIEKSSEFVARVVARKVEASLQPGTYKLDSNMSTDDIINMLIKK